jgi:homoserine dehydrogenase
VAALARDAHARLAASGIELQVVSALVRDLAKSRSGPPVPLSAQAAEVLDSRPDIVVEVLGGLEPARTLVAASLRAGVPVVSANKTLIAAAGQELKAIADAHGTVLACEAAVLAGVPFLGSLSRRPLVSAARRIEGILNGTSHFILGCLDRGWSFDDAVADAVARGYAEPDSSADTGGRDAAEKLTILLHLAGCRDVRVTDIPRTSLDVLDAADLAGARFVGGTIKPVAFASLDADNAGAWVGPAFVPRRHPLAALEGVANALRLTGADGHTVTFAGPGAGPDVTAVTIVDDIVETLTGARTAAAIPADTSVSGEALSRPPGSAWFLRLVGAPSIWPADALEVCASRGVPVAQSETAGDRWVALTASVSWPAIQEAAAAFQSRGVRVLALPALDVGKP